MKREGVKIKESKPWTCFGHFADDLVYEDALPGTGRTSFEAVPFESNAANTSSHCSACTSRSHTAQDTLDARLLIGRFIAFRGLQG